MMAYILMHNVNLYHCTLSVNTTYLYNIQRRSNVIDVGSTLYKCYTDVLLYWDSVHSVTYSNSANMRWRVNFELFFNSLCLLGCHTRRKNPRKNKKYGIWKDKRAVDKSRNRYMYDCWPHTQPIACMETSHSDCIRSIFNSAARPSQRNASRTQTCQWKGSLRIKIYNIDGFVIIISVYCYSY